MRGVPVIAANPRDASSLLRFLVDAPNTDPEIGQTRLVRARARGRVRHDHLLARLSQRRAERRAGLADALD
jgi:hypothetical protein